jgi:predicted acylesterase/phospholipase RssA/CRP-like cAMP-binding protein
MTATTAILARNPLFAGVSPLALERLEERLQVRRFAAGEIILRAGAPSAQLFGLMAGAVRVEVSHGTRRVLLVPPQCFGELSALTGDPASATVVAQRNATTWVLSADALFDVLGQDSAFFRNVATLLGQRLRERTRRTHAARPRVVLAVAAEARDATLLAALAKGLHHYAPGSEQCTAHEDVARTVQRVRRWHDEAAGGAVLLVALSPDRCAALLDELDVDDALLLTEDQAATLLDTLATPVLWHRSERATGMAQRWSHALADDEIHAAAASEHWSRARWPAMDHVVRRLCGREVGLAMSVGAAAGLAHLGVLEVLEGDGLPLDFVCGSSMGGAVALAYAHFDNARAATEAILRLVAEFARRKGLQWLPRASLVSASRMAALTRELYGDVTFAQLRRPASVVAADLTMGTRVVLDSGLVASAACATAAIPGIFAPVRRGDAVLVDGGVVTRVPADLLAARGCGLKLAALARPEYAKAGDAARAADRLESRLRRPFGLRAALGGSWRMLGWWDSASQAERADLMIAVPTPIGEGLNFAAAEAMVDCGRRAALEHLPQLRSALHHLLARGVP